MSKPRIQPARAAMRAKRLTDKQAAALIGVRPVHLGCAIGGRVRPCNAIRERLPILLDTPIEQLFFPDLLDRPFQGDLGIGFQSYDPVSWDVPGYAPLHGGNDR